MYSICSWTVFKYPMQKIQFIFGIHNHQPVGNFDDVLHHACDHSYLPFLKVLDNHPRISMAFHFSGSLIEWLEAHRPDVLALFKKLIERGNIEVLGAGFYEPILAMIPEKDQIGQIKKMTDWAQDRLNYQIQGNWLTERVWEPHLAASIRKAGIDYMVVDDYHFLTSGVDPTQLNGYFHTEHEGEVLSVFPISQRLRYAMPFEDPQVTIDYLKSQATETGDTVVVMADDGEKFGVWPGTYQSVYEDGWLEGFFTLLDENSDWLETTTFKTYHAQHAPLGLVYLPTASYFEMSQWTLSTEAGKRMDLLVHQLQHENRWEENRAFIKGGMWRNFLTKYAESNWMQKRVQFLSQQLWQLEEKGTLSSDLLDDVYRAQCNCAYWHGVFGGLYLPHLRHAIYEHLLKAEATFIKAGGALPGLADIDADGIDEYRLRSDKLQLFVAANSGQIREVDWLPANFNLSNYLQRYAEHYHDKLALAGQDLDGGGSIHDLILTKEDGLQDKLFVDSYSRKSLVDHFFNAGEKLSTYYEGRLPNNLKSMDTQVEQSEAGVTIVTQGVVAGAAITIKKQLALHHNELAMDLEIHNEGLSTFRSQYGCEFNFGLLGGNSPDRYYLLNDEHAGALNSMGEHQGIKSLALITEWEKIKVQLQFSDPCQLWRAPIETVSMSEAGFERVYQASSLLPHWEIDLDPGDHIKLKIVLSAEIFK